jgi:CHAD domain-containing protein
VEHSPERELKLAATPDFRMPSVYGLVGSTVRQAPAERNDTTYYDTEDLRLARWGASLRHRPGEGWTVKLPAERDAPYLVRPELVFEGNGNKPPAEAVALVRGFVRGAELHERVRMTTIRRRTGLHDVNGKLLAGVVDDTVSVENGQESRTAFRELEVEIGDETTPGLLDALVERLRQAGAGAPDQTAKYIRALGTGAPLTPEIAVNDLGADASAGGAVQRALALSAIRLIRHDAVMRLDADPEGVHQARVATRRLRSDLRTFRSLLDEEFASSLRSELGWLADILGDVRDGDVLLERLRRRATELPEADRDAAAPVLASLQADRDAANTALLEALASRRYLRLLDRLVAAADDPALDDDASAPASDVLPGLVRRPWHKLAKRVEALDESPSFEELHAVRIRTKRARYAAEAAAPVVGKQARAFAHAAADLQDVLGDLNDAVVAARRLDEWATQHRTEDIRGAEALAALERAAAGELRGRWRPVWEELAAPKLRAWM